MWRRVCWCLRLGAGCAGRKRAERRNAKLMRARGIVLAGIAAACVLGASVQAGAVLEEPEDSGLGWWSAGAGDEGVGSAPMPVAISDAGDWAWRRGSLYGGMKRPSHRWAGDPRPGWNGEASAFPEGGMFSGGGSMAAAGSLTSCTPCDAWGAPIEALGTNTGLWLGGTVTQAGYSVVFAGGDFAYASGSLVLSGGGVLSTGTGVFDLTNGGTSAPGVIFDGSLWTAGQDGTLTLAGSALSPVPEPGSLALAGLGFFLTAWLVRKGGEVWFLPGVDGGIDLLRRGVRMATRLLRNST